MDYPNERFVKVYTRNDEDWLVLSWHAQSLLLHMVRAVDRAGVLETRRGPAGVAALLRGPLDVVEPALTELIREGHVEAHELGYVIPRHLEAQDASQSDRQRQRQHRERRRTGIASDTESHDVTNRDSERDDVTSGHASSQSVTTDRQTRQTDKTDELAALAVAEINRLRGTHYEATSTTTIKHCKALVKSGVTVADLPLVLESKWREWSKSDQMRDQFKPSVLLRPSNFAKYREDIAAGARPPARLTLVTTDSDEMTVNT